MRVAGLMSGTSFDSIDVAIADFELKGSTVQLTPVGSDNFEYPADLQRKIASVISGASVSAEDFCMLDTGIGQAFADAVLKLINRYGSNTDLICSHGQTLYHWEESGKTLGTLQLGNPAWIAERTGISVISDLRSRDVAAGGNGAPLVSCLDVMLARQYFTSPVAFLNLGGIANVTVVAEGLDPVAYDIGPANALMDIAVSQLTGGSESFDRDGRLASAGNVNQPLLMKLANHPYYALPLPKTTGKETFGTVYVTKLLEEFAALTPQDTLATLTWHVGQKVAHEVVAQGVDDVVVSGGGERNPALMEVIESHLGTTNCHSIQSLGVSGDDKEAYAFALLGFLTMNSIPATIPTCTGAYKASLLGSLTPGSSVSEQAARLPQALQILPST